MNSEERYQKYFKQEVARQAEKMFEVLEAAVAGKEVWREASSLIGEIKSCAKERAEAYRVGVILYLDDYGSYKIASVHKTDSEAAKALKAEVDFTYGECDEPVMGGQYTHPESHNYPRKNDGITCEVVRETNGTWRPKR